MTGSTNNWVGNIRKPGDVYLLKLSPEPVPFVRGHVNSDSVSNTADAICLLGYLFGVEGGSCMEGVARCLDACDTNDDGAVDVANAITVLSHLFANAGPLQLPSTSCGYDETHDELRCFHFAGCP